MFAVDAFATAEQVEKATADGRAIFQLQIRKEIDMTTNKPVELGKASEETKEVGHGPTDNDVTPIGPLPA
jgi:hypothetical protein